MVLNAPRPASSFRERLDATRIAGISGTLLLNAAAFAVLLIPLSRVDVAKYLPAPAVNPRLVDLDKPLPPIPPPPPLPVQQIQPQPQSTPLPPVANPVPVAVTAPSAVAANSEAVVVDSAPGDLPAGASTVTPSLSVETGAGSDGWLATLTTSTPRYPREAILNGWEGTVVLRVEVDALGRATSVSIERSSGHRALDTAARREVLRWTFQPAVRNGQPVAAAGLVPVDFKLD